MVLSIWVQPRHSLRRNRLVSRRRAAVARAHRWFDEISTGKARSLAAIAAREGLAVRYVGRLIRLAFLAPDIVESIVEGRQPTSLTTEAVTRRVEIPLELRRRSL